MAERISKDSESDQEERPSSLTSLVVYLRTKRQMSGGFSLQRENDDSASIPTSLQMYTILPLVTIRFLSSGMDNGRSHDFKAKVFQTVRELAPEVDCDLVLQHLSEVDTDNLVECGLKIARRYRQLEEENESYRQCKEVFANLYEKEKGKVKELKTKLAETNKAMEKMKKENAKVLEQLRQDYLKERRQLEAECERLRCILKHDEEEWMKEKQLLLEQIRNVRNEQRIETESRQWARFTGKT